MKLLALGALASACLFMAYIYLTSGGHDVTYVKTDYDIICIKGVSYIAINRNLNSAMMSVMLDKESKVVPCNN